MAVEEKVVIKVEIDPDMTRAAAVNTFLSTLDRNAQKVNRTLNKTADTFRKDLGRALAQTAARMADFGRGLIKLNLKTFGVELALVTAGLLSMKAALATGNGIMKAWANTVKFARAATAGLAAGVTALVATLTAANRQFQQFQLAPFVGGVKNARTAMGSMGVGSGAVMGVQAMSQAMATLAKSGTDVTKIGPILRQVGNIASGDPKQFQALTKAMATVQSTGKTAAGVKALQGLGPAFADAAKRAGSMSGQQFMTALQSGGLTPQGFKGQLGALDQTLMGGAKGMVTRMYTSLADVGNIFLDPLRNAMTDAEKILSGGLFRMMGAIRQFGLDTFVPGFVNVLQRFIDWMVLLTNRDLPKLMGYLTAIADWWRDFKSGMSKFFGKMGDGMRKFSESAEIAWEMTKALFGEIKRFISGTFDKWDSGIVNNARAFEDFGRSLGNLLVAVLEMLTRFKDTFFDAMPTLTNFFDFIANNVFPALGNFASTFLTAFTQALPVVEQVTRLLLPLLEMLNATLGGIGGIPGIGGMLVAGLGMATLTRGGRAGTAAFGRGAMNPLMSTAGMAAWPAVMAGMGKKFGGTKLGARFQAGVGGARSFFGNKLGDSRRGMPTGMHGPAAPSRLARFGHKYMSGRRLSAGMGAMGGLMGLSGVMSATTTGGGIGAGALGGASMGAMFGPWGALAGGIIGGVAGGIRGWLKRDAMKDAGEELAATMVSDTLEAMGDASRAGRAQILADYDALLANEGALKQRAEQEGVDLGTLRSGLTNKRIKLMQEQTALNTQLDLSLSKLAQTTGLTNKEIEKMADNMGIAVHTAVGRAAFMIEHTSGFGSWNKSQVSSAIEDAYWNRVRNGAFAGRVNITKTGQQTRAATANLFASMQGGGPLDNELADRTMQAFMAEGAALGLRGGALMNWIDQGLRGMGARADGLGWGVGGSAAMDDFVKTGLRASAGAKEDFMKGAFATQIKQRLKLINPEMTQGAINAKLKDAWSMGDPDTYLANLNTQIHTKAAEEVMMLAGAAQDAGTSLAGFAGIMQAILTGDKEAIDLWLSQNRKTEGSTGPPAENQNSYGYSPTVSSASENALFQALQNGASAIPDNWNAPKGE